MPLMFESKGSFAELIGESGPRLPSAMLSGPALAHGLRDIDTHGTTVIAVKYKDGLINVADRRATSGMAIMYDQAEKVLALDDYTLISISGSYAKSVEVVRFLRHTFKYFERSQLQPMSLEGKLMELQRLIANNLGAAMQGVGMFIPVLSTFNPEDGQGHIYFYDAMGGQFETAEYGAAGSGSGPIRGAFEYILRTKGPFRDMSREAALQESITLLEIASDLDTATGGSAKFLPAAKYITAAGIQDFTDDEIKAALGRG